MDIQAPTYFAQLAQEAEARNRQRRGAVGWQVSETEVELQDAVDGDIDMDVVPPVHDASTIAAVATHVGRNDVFFKKNCNKNCNLH